MTDEQIPPTPSSPPRAEPIEPGSAPPPARRPSPIGASRRWAPPSRHRALLAALLVGVAICGLFAVTWWLHRPKAVAATRAIGARLDLAAGEVTVEESGKSAKAISGTPLAVSSRVKTGPGSRALIRTGDGASIFLRGDTDVVLEAKGFAVERGEVWLDAPLGEGEAVACQLGHHTVSASSAGLSVKRTGDDVELYVARGLAILTSPGGRVEINAGEQGSA